jgi:hypothetical protein
MKTSFIRIVLITAALCLVSASSRSPYPTLPDPELSPGVACPTVTVAMLKVKGYAGQVRKNGTPDGEKITQADKDKVYAEYHITSHTAGEFEIDHLISLELGGSNNIKNLWPESYTGDWNAHVKDQLENELHREVISGQRDLKQVQHDIATNWIKLYKEVFPERVDASGKPIPQDPEPDSEPDRN